MDLFRDTHIDFMKYRKFWIVISLALVVVGIFSVFVHGKLNLGIDFAGGTQLTLKFDQRPEIDELRGLVSAAGFPDAQLQSFGEADEHEVIIKTPTIEGSEEGSRDPIVNALDARLNPEAGGKLDLNRAGLEEIVGLLVREDPDRRAAAGGAEAARAYYAPVAEAVIAQRRVEGLLASWDEVTGAPGVKPSAAQVFQRSAHLGHFAVLGVENVGPQIGEELRTKGVLAVVMSLIGMLAYIWLRFELRFGIGALMASVHDVLVCLGLFALAGFEFNLTTIAAFLTLVGYSVNDTVIIFDRVRENMNKNRRQPLIEVMNESLNQTLSRTVLTSGTTLLAVTCLLIFGGDVLRGFAFVLTVGIVVGTYSSVYIASPFALLWEQMFGSDRRARRSAAKATQAKTSSRGAA
jgi:preprotein translocase subunit SecF